MGIPAQSKPRLCFEEFELDLSTQELWTNGTKLMLQEQPFQILVALLERPGHVVSREELRQKLWSSDTFVNFDLSLNKALHRLREALGDTAQTPRFIETLPRRGYRFIGRVIESPKSGPSPVGDESDGAVKPEQRVAEGGAAVGRSLFSIKAASVGIVLLSGIAFVSWLVTSPSSPVILQARAITQDGRAKGVYATVATDGTRVYFEEVSAGRETATQVSASGGETSEIPIPLKGTIYGISPDGSQMLFGAEMPGGIQLWVQPLPTGPPRRVGDLLASDGAWAPGGQHIVYVSDRSLFWANADGSGIRKIGTMQGDAAWPSVSPDGQKIRLTVADSTGSSRTLWEVSSDGSGLKPLLAQWAEAGDQCCGRWTNDGKYYIFQNARDGASDLWVLPERRNWLRGSESGPIQLTHGPLEFFLPQPSRDDRTIFALGEQLKSELVRYDLTSEAFVPYLGGISANDVEISRDGGWAAYVAYPEDTLWRCRIDGSERLQLTSTSLHAARPRWSPDGTQIAFTAWSRGMVFSSFIVSASGGTVSKILPDRAINPAWSPDGTRIAFNHFVTGMKPGDPESMQVEFLDIASQKTSVVPSSDGIFIAAWSPNGHYLLAKTSDHHVALLFDLATEQWTKISEADMLTNLQFSRSGASVYFEATSTSQAVLMRMRLADHKIEQVMDFRNIRRPLAQLSSAWVGLADDDSPLMQRDIGTQEIYALEWRAP
jgi:Tol biopolymer transport system component/DNA-binding winged helix-turn-helix (wHTH) protein